MAELSNYPSGSGFFIRWHHLPSELFDCTKTALQLYNCQICKVNFDIVINLRNHISEKHATKKRGSLLTHVVKSYMCDTCSFETYSSLQWLRHNECSKSTRRWNMKDKPSKHRIFQCNECEFTTKWWRSLPRHKLAKHTASKKQFHCDKCAYKATCKSHIDFHYITKHSDDKTTRKDRIGPHFTKHKDQKWLQCEKCTYKSKLKHDLKKHVLAKHTDDENKKWLHCGKCTFKTIWRESLCKHQNAKHSNDEDKKWFRCAKCSFKSMGKGNLERHVTSNHMGGRKE